MITKSVPHPTSQSPAQTFETGQVVTIMGAHFVHDTYTAFVAPLLPLIIAKLSISLTLAGTLTAILQLPAILNPLIGYLAERVSLRYFVILSPAVTATLISSLGFADNYFSLALLLLLTGLSVAAFHAPAPAMIAPVSGRQIGKGMGLFMAGGELGRTLGPLVAVWGATLWGLEGIARLMVAGWLTSALLFVRLRHVAGHIQKPAAAHGFWQVVRPKLLSLYLPLALFLLAGSFLRLGLS
ncbi:MAG: MFS transporter, partial [Anaerolineales bacterium]|nr:MFS transporter [Anaerolineales bacterium]